MFEAILARRTHQTKHDIYIYIHMSVGGWEGGDGHKKAYGEDNIAYL